MSVMSVMSEDAATGPTPTRGLRLPWGRELTRADLATMPDDGHRYELVDGVLIVSPSPRLRHQRAAKALLSALERSCPADLEVLFAPFDVVLAQDSVLIPDLIVARRDDLTEVNLPTAPVLAAEVLSPSTRRVDVTLKRSRLEAAGCEHYWVVDPDVPSVLAWRLVAGEYVEAARATGSERLAVESPYPIRIVPADLGA